MTNHIDAANAEIIRQMKAAVDTPPLHFVLQGSPEWHALRCGKVTASRIADLTAKLKGGVASASRAAYMGQLIAERLTKVVQESYVNQAMQDGKDREAEARGAYMFHTDTLVQEVAFVDHPVIPLCGCSPDGLIGVDGLIEIKSPAVHTHIETLDSESIDMKYVKQMQFQMACCRRLWCDYVSYHPHLPEKMRLFVKRVSRDAGMIMELEAEVDQFQVEIFRKIERLQGKYK